jgi:hypothetical protein
MRKAPFLQFGWVYRPWDVNARDRKTGGRPPGILTKDVKMDYTSFSIHLKLLSYFSGTTLAKKSSMVPTGCVHAPVRA